MSAELRRFAHRSIVVLSLAAARIAGTAQAAAPETNSQLIEELRAGKGSVAQASWWGFSRPEGNEGTASGRFLDFARDQLL